MGDAIMVMVRLDRELETGRLVETGEGERSTLVAPPFSVDGHFGGLAGNKPVTGWLLCPIGPHVVGDVVNGENGDNMLFHITNLRVSVILPFDLFGMRRYSWRSASCCRCPGCRVRQRRDARPRC